MRKAAEEFVGMRDFKSFAQQDDEPDENRRSTLVLVDRLEIADDSDLVLLRIEGSHFLWKMVRRIVGVLVEVGRGNLPAGDAAAFLTTSSEMPARLTAPPSGLFLDRVYFAGDPRNAALRPATPLRPSKQAG
jgi:tRNA pseudouridine38-40 synthase